jgi:dihydrodipicolinate synthase/N-acetylneuraminate lyase
MPPTDALRGAYCPLIVPFCEGKIDYDTYGKLIERQIAEGTHGLLVNATSGEPTMLTLQERADLTCDVHTATSNFGLPGVRIGCLKVPSRESRSYRRVPTSAWRLSLPSAL